MAEKGINPVDKILELLQFVDEETQIKTWLHLLQYTEPKVTELPEQDPAESVSQKLENVTDEQLIQAIEYKEKPE